MQHIQRAFHARHNRAAALIAIMRFSSSKSAAATVKPPRDGAPTEVEYTQWKKELVMKAGVTNPYPTPNIKYTEIRKFMDSFSDVNNTVQPNQWNEAESWSLAGRLVARRDASSKLSFLDLVQNGHRTQIAAQKNHYTGDNYDAIMGVLSPGDIIGVTGFPGKTKAGQLSLKAREITLLAPCLHRIPQPNSLHDIETRSRQRYLDMLVNPKSLADVMARSKIISHIRSFLEKKGFLEVETPVLASQSGGATARPFVTKMNALDMELQLRIAPELYLKQLVVGGIDRVFEIGKQFRNEGIDSTHSPEFSTCEFYEAYGDLEATAEMVRQLIQESLVATNNSTKLVLKSGVEFDFSQPFKRIDVSERLRQFFAGSITSLDFSTVTTDQLLEVCRARSIPVKAPFTVPRILDDVIAAIIEPECIEPTFLFGHPSVMSPLAKDTAEKGVSARFELFVDGKELVNAYVEMNDPVEQLQRFQLQSKFREQGDAEAQELDQSFCTALEYGLPPTVGCGIGIDRLVMLATGCTRIRDVIPFPLLAQNQNNKS